MRAIVAVLLLAACSGEDTTYDPDVTLPIAFTQCDDAPDCTIVQLGCCDHCNGGQAVAVRVDQAAAARAEYGESCAPERACTEMGCASLEAACQDNTCVAVQQPLR